MCAQVDEGIMMSVKALKFDSNLGGSQKVTLCFLGKSIGKTLFSFFTPFILSICCEKHIFAAKLFNRNKQKNLSFKYITQWQKKNS